MTTDIQQRLAAWYNRPLKVELEYRDPGDIRNVFSAVGAASTRVLRRDKVLNLVRLAGEAVRRRCGNCNYWMKSSLCPREHNVKGYSRGPSCDAYPCGKFEMQQWSIDLQAKYLAEADALMTEMEQSD